MIGRPGVAKAIFSILADHEVNVMMISQGSSEANISLIVDESHLQAATEALRRSSKQGICPRGLATTTMSVPSRLSVPAWPARPARAAGSSRRSVRPGST